VNLLGTVCSSVSDLLEIKFPFFFKDTDIEFAIKQTKYKYKKKEHKIQDTMMKVV